MADRSDPPDRPTVRGPWQEVTGLEQVFDRGASWCINADGHPDYDYPDPAVHVPWFECRTAGLAIEAAPNLTGATHVLEAYVARPFRFGQMRDAGAVEPTRLIFEVTDAAGAIAARFSVSLGDALRLSRHVARLIDLVDQRPER